MPSDAARISGERFGPYVVEGRLGHGGMGTVLRCRHERSGQIVALKTAEGAQAHFQRMLRDELALLRRLCRLGHPSIVRVLDSGSAAGLSWYAMEHVEGRTLQAYKSELWSAWDSDEARRSTVVENAARTELPARGSELASDSEAEVERDSLPPAAAGRMSEVLSLAAQLARALVFIHGQGTSHGDLSQRNVLVRDDGTPVLIDFGMSSTAFSGPAAREMMRLEQRYAGTPGFLAPEVIRGEAADSRSDLYAFGCILFELVTGRAPFVASSGGALLRQHLALDPPAPSSLARGIPRALEQLILELLEKAPRRRIGFAVDVARRLADLRGTHPDISAPVMPVHLFRSRMVERSDALDALRRMLTQAAAGSGGCAFVVGESGIGKTRFAIEVSQAASVEGFEVVAAQCGAPGDDMHAAANAPLAPFAAFLRWLSDRVRREPERHAQAATPLRILARYEPLLAEQIVPESVPAMAPEPARARLRAALSAALVDAAQTAPLLLLIDDLQWADELTLDFLLSADAAALAQSRVLVLALARREQFEPTLDRLAQRHPERTAVLGRLSLSGVRRVVQDMLALELPPAGFVESIFDHAEGNPLFIAELLKAAAQRGLLRRGDDCRWQLPEQIAHLFGQTSLPESLRSTISLRLADLDPSSQHLLALCAVLGREFSREVLLAVCRGLVPEVLGHALPAPSEILVTLDGLVARHVLERADERFRFAHDKLREVVLDALPAVTHGGLHRLAARALARHGERPGSHAAIGFHWAAGGRPLRAVPYLLRAAARAAAMHANASAVDLYAVALRELGAQAGGAESRARVLKTLEVAEVRAQLLTTLARNAEAIDQLGRAASGASEHGLLLRARLYRRMARPLRAEARYDEAGHALGYARALLGDVHEQEHARELRSELIEIQLEHTDLHYFADKNGSAMLRSLDECAPVIERDGTPTQRCRFYVSRANSMLLERRYQYSEEAVGLVRRALEESSAQGASTLELDGIRFELAFMLLAGSSTCCAEAAQLLEQAYARVPEHGHVPLAAHLTAYLAVAHRRLQRVDEAERWGSRAAEAASESNRPGYLGAAYGVLAWVELRRLRPLECAALARQATDLWWRNRARPGHVRREEFPFQWLALLPLAAASIAAEQLPRAQQALAELLPAPQLRLPAELEVCVRDATRTTPASYAQLNRALGLARQLGYL